MATNREDRDLYRVWLGSSPTMYTDVVDVLAQNIVQAIKTAMKSWHEPDHRVVRAEVISSGWILQTPNKEKGDTDV